MHNVAVEMINFFCVRIRAISRNQIDLVKGYLKSGHDLNITYAVSDAPVEI